MYITLSILIGLGMAGTAIALTYLVSRIRVFQESFEILDKYRIGSKPKGKAELRRYRRLKTIIGRAKRNIMILFFIHLSIFIITYTTAIVLTGLTIPGNEQLVKIPVAIPLFSDKADGLYITHVLFIVFTAYLAPNYLLIRAVRPAQRITGPVKFKNNLTVK